MQSMELKDRYVKAWSTFSAEMASLGDDLDRAVELAIANNSGAPLHSIIQALRSVPYEEAPKILAVPREAQSKNIGPITGLFFEHIVVCVVVPFLRGRCDGISFERNCCTNRNIRKVARDPDLVASLNGRTAIFEMKVSPKRRDLDHVRKLRKRYEATGDADRIAYYLIGGWVSLHYKDLALYKGEPRVTFMSASSRNEQLLTDCTTLDRLLNNAARFLNEGSHGEASM